MELFYNIPILLKEYCDWFFFFCNQKAERMKNNFELKYMKIVL